ncbi:hypothetical protein ACT3SZ_11095 [Corynebacterium sp. AOP40-9SA-29]|uniref:hypothetical protein n=1 Tax=Corynebacterium sp. AOP40-9SA-29 TaxID=3457677 RepID=UPI004034F3CE
MTVILVALLGLFGMSTNPVLIGMAVRYADKAPTLASAMATAAFNFGTAVGSWIAGMTLATAMGASGPVAVVICVAALYVIPLTLLLCRERADLRRATSDEESTETQGTQCLPWRP